ncbi:MAG: hypothetical protein QOH36_1274 [Actinomycetota bacterium]|nr:hypothetical protein [Actinomycetota bacterium]
MTGRGISATLIVLALGTGCGRPSDSRVQSRPEVGSATPPTKPALVVTIPPGPDSTPWWTITSLTTTGETVAGLPADLLFAVDSAALSRDADLVLRDVLVQALGHPAATIQIDGHSDSDGRADYNQRLSEARARAVGQWLVTHGIEERRITAEGWGASRPIATNADATGKARNRRVEITLRSAS